MRILLLGAKGQLGSELARKLDQVGELICCSRSEVDLADNQSVLDAINRIQPQIIVNAAAYTAVDKAESEVDLAFQINSAAVKVLANESVKRGIFLIHYSTDYVFDGNKTEPYCEDDATNPVNVYGASKLSGERAITESGCNHIIFRTTWVIGTDGNNFAKTMLRLMVERDVLSVINDQHGVPTSTSLISRVTMSAIKAISADKSWPSGIYHLSPSGKTTWYDLTLLLIDLAEIKGMQLAIGSESVQAIPTIQYPTPAKRPLNSILDTCKIENQLEFAMPDWRSEFEEVANNIIEEYKT